MPGLDEKTNEELCKILREYMTVLEQDVKSFLAGKKGYSVGTMAIQCEAIGKTIGDVGKVFRKRIP